MNPYSPSDLGENLAREWGGDARASRLRDVLNTIKDNPSSGLKELTRLAEDGSALSMMYLGDIYINGEYGISKNSDLGESWLRKSAAAGSIEGSYGLAWYLMNSGNYNLAINIYNELSTRGYSPAQFRLGWIYYKGEIVERDLERAIFYYRMAEKAGHFHASNQIARIMMRIEMGPVSWVRGLFKRIRLVIPFVKNMLLFPNSDKFRS